MRDIKGKLCNYKKDMEIKTFNSTLIGKNVSISTDNFSFSSNGVKFSMTSDVPTDTPDFNRLIILCNEIRKMFIEIKNILKEYEKV